MPDLLLGERPIVNSLQDAPIDAEIFEIRMGMCQECGLINTFHKIPLDNFYSEYSTPSHWKNEPHLESLISRMSSRYSKQSKVLDIGCNDGGFLYQLKAKGFECLVGVEPSANVANMARDKEMLIYNDFFDLELVKILEKKHDRFDIVVSRQVLEHVKNIKEFLLNIHQIIGKQGVLILEVPDSGTNLEYLDYGIWEEHLNYFTKTSLDNILRRTGWEVLEWYRSNFSGGCQTVIAQVSTDNSNATESSIDDHVQYTFFSSNLHRFREYVHKEIGKYKATGRVNLLGVGSRSLSTLWSLGIVDQIDNFYDENQNKVGKYVPNTGKKIKDCSEIEDLSTDLLLLGVNMENESACLGRIQPEIMMWRSILPPSEHLLWKDFWTAHNP